MTTNIDFVPQFHLTNVSTNLINKINKIQEPPITIPVLKTIGNQLSDISKSSNSLDSVINMLEIQEESLRKETYLTTHNYSLYAVIIIVGYIVIHIIIKYIKNKCRSYFLETATTQPIRRRQKSYLDAPV